MPELNELRAQALDVLTEEAVAINGSYARCMGIPYASAGEATAAERKVADLFGYVNNERFGCYDSKVRSLMRKALGVLGVDVPSSVTFTKDNYPKGCVLVPLSNPNGNNYPIGQPCVIVSGIKLRAYRMDGTIGNTLPAPSNLVATDEQEPAMRLATREEIRALFASAYAADRIGKIVLLYDADDEE